MTEEFTAIRLAKTSLDLVQQVKPVQGLSDFVVIGEILHCLQYLLLRFHGNSPIPERILALTVRGSQLASLSDGRLDSHLLLFTLTRIKPVLVGQDEARQLAGESVR